MESLNVMDKFKLFSETWTPHVIATCNDQFVKIAKVHGEFVWHDHKNEDELFYVLKGKLFIDTEEKTFELNEGDMMVVPKATKHRPRSGPEETWIILIEPKETKHTGDEITDLTKDSPVFI